MGNPPSPAQTAPRRRLGARSPATCRTSTRGWHRHQGVARVPSTMQRHRGMLSLPIPDLRSRLHLDGAHLLQLLLGDVRELLRQLTLLALEVLQLVDDDLRQERRHRLPLQPLCTGSTLSPTGQAQAGAEGRAPAMFPLSWLPRADAAALLQQSWALRVPLPRWVAPGLPSAALYWPKVFAQRSTG